MYKIHKWSKTNTFKSNIDFVNRIFYFKNPMWKKNLVSNSSHFISHFLCTVKDWTYFKLVKIIINVCKANDRLYVHINV